MNNNELALSFRSLGYRDYIAARILLNKNYPLQGITLASSAIEKYLKVILASVGLKKKDMNYHLDRLDKLQALLQDKYSDVTKKFDGRFLELLGKAYQARYYDNLSQPLMIGFFVKQFTCELDYAVNILEQALTVSDSNGNPIRSAYQRAIIGKDDDLLQNNYIFLNISKKDFMEQPDQGFGVFIDPINGFREIEIEGKDIRNTYDGTIADIRLAFK